MIMPASQSQPEMPVPLTMGPGPLVDHPVDEPRPAPLRALDRAAVLDIPLAVTDYTAAMDWMDEVVASDGRVSISAAAVHLVMVAQHDDETRDAVRDMVTVPDGQPLVWALRGAGATPGARI